MSGDLRGETDAGVLSTVEEVRALSLEEAEERRPVRLEGVVVYHDDATGHAFLHDGTGSLFIRCGEPGEIRLETGEKISVSGATIRGNYSPSVAGRGSAARAGEGGIVPVEIRKLGTGVVPKAVGISPEDLLTGEFHDQFVSVDVTIRRVENFGQGKKRNLTLHVSTHGGPWMMPVHILGSDLRPEHWQDTPARITGIAAGNGDTHGRLQGIRLLVPGAERVETQSEALEAAFSDPAVPVSSLFGYQPQTTTANRTKVSGTVTLARPGEGFFLNDGEEGLFVQTPQSTDLRNGLRLEVVGFPVRDKRMSYLDDGIFRIIGKAPEPSGRRVSFEQAASGNFSAQLVTLQGEFTDGLEQTKGDTLFLSDRGRRFAARMPTGEAVLGKLKTGSRISITGICEPPPSGPRVGPPIAAFTLLARGAGDVSVIKPPPLLNPTRTRWILAGACLALVLGIGWVLLLGRQVRKQSSLIAAHAGRQILVEERQRMARELHDTLEQHLTGLQIQLDALEEWSARAEPGVRKAVANARAMLTHSRDETRRSVFELRSQALEELGLVGAVQRFASQFSDSPPPEIRVESLGEEQQLSGRVRFHLLRIAQEAINNSVRHADAEAVEVLFDFSREHLKLTIRDDGRGFDPAGPADDPRPRFGIKGMRERAAKIRAKIEISSSPKSGTFIEINLTSSSENV